MVLEYSNVICRPGLLDIELSGIALGYRLDDRGLETRQVLGIFLFTTAPRPALGLIQSPIQWVTGALLMRVKRLRREADHSPPSSAEDKSAWSYVGSIPRITVYECVLEGSWMKAVVMLLARCRPRSSHRRYKLIEANKSKFFITKSCPLFAQFGQNVFTSDIGIQFLRTPYESVSKSFRTESITK
jgi:hypothetical protein